MAQAGRTRIRPRPDGEGFGTIGMVLEAPGAGGAEAAALYLLSCGHVLAPPRMAAPPTEVEDAETGEALAEAARATLPLGGPREPFGLDVGIARLLAACDPAIPEVGSPAAVARPGDLESDEDAGAGQGAALRVFGAASRRLVETRLIRRDAEATIRYLDANGAEHRLPLKGQYLIEANGLIPGDSGALVMAGGLAAAMVVGFDLADQQLVVATPIGPVLREASALAGEPLRPLLDFSRVRADPGEPMDGTAPAVAAAALPAAGGTAGQPYAITDVEAALGLLGLDAADWPLLAGVLAVESAGFGFLASRRPKILFERHVFSRETGRRFDGEDPSLSSPTSGGYRGGEAEHDRLEAAKALCARAGLPESHALRSASWGLGQVMGFNHAAVGFGSAADMVGAFAAGEPAQLAAMVRFITGKGLAQALRDEDWHGFARGYNGSNYAAHDYHGRLARAVALARGAARPDPGLRRVQAALLYLRHLGRPGQVDGLAGPGTRAAIKAWQTAKAHAATGELTGSQEADLIAEARV